MAEQAEVSADRLFLLLVERVREAGALVSPKIHRAALPPLRVPGLVASRSLVENEEIIRIPSSVHLTLPVVQELGGNLVSSVHSLNTDKVRVEFPEVVAFVAKKLHSLKALHSEDSESSWSDATWLELMLGMQLDTDYRYMPHRRLIEDTDAKSLMLPSPEVHNAVWSETAYCDAHEAITQSVAVEVLGPNFDLETFKRSHLLLLSRTFAKTVPGRCRIEHCCVPVADMFNHSSDANCDYELDVIGGDFVVSVNRDVAAGEELFISYGREKSNVRLFRTYGFTVDPRTEPSWSFRVWPRLAQEVYAQFLPASDQLQVLDLETRRVHETTRGVLQACTSHGKDPSDFLRTVCNHFRRMYEADALLQPALLALRDCRSQQPKEFSWWTAEEETLKAFLASLCSDRIDDARLFAEDAMRVKMSEYLCLLAHIEALDILAGSAQAASCFDHSCGLSTALAEALGGCKH
jgi:hypothetical protein